MKIICKSEYLSKAKLLNHEEAERLLSRMAGKMSRRLAKGKLSKIQALAMQMESEDERLQQWRETSHILQEKPKKKSDGSAKAEKPAKTAKPAKAAKLVNTEKTVKETMPAKAEKPVKVEETVKVEEIVKTEVLANVEETAKAASPVMPRPKKAKAPLKASAAPI